MEYQKIRNFLYNLIDDDITNDFNLEEAIKHLEHTICLILDHDNVNFQNLKHAVLEIFFADSFTYLLYREKLGVNTFEEKSNLYYFFRFQSIENIIMEIEMNQRLLNYFIEYFIRFYESKQSLKIIMIKSLKANELRILSNVAFPYIRETKKDYKLIKLSLLIQEIKEDIKEQLEIHEVLISYIIIDYLVQIVQQLLIIDFQNGISLLLEIADLDYNILRFLIDHGLKDEGIINNISFYEKSVDFMIFDQLSNNREYLTNIFERMIKIIIDQNISGIPITLKELEKSKYSKNDYKRKRKE